MDLAIVLAPIPPKRQPSPRLDAKSAHWQSEMCYASASMLCTCRKGRKRRKTIVARESDQTLEPPSRYGTVAEWKEVKNPPEGAIKTF